MAKTISIEHISDICCPGTSCLFLHHIKVWQQWISIVGLWPVEMWHVLSSLTPSVNVYWRNLQADKMPTNAILRCKYPVARFSSWPAPGVTLNEHCYPFGKQGSYTTNRGAVCQVWLWVTQLHSVYLYQSKCPVHRGRNTWACFTVFISGIDWQTV